MTRLEEILEELRHQLKILLIKIAELKDEFNGS